jgi:ubiquitin fusion degradation protein 1
METLSLEVGDLVQVQSTELPLGTLVKLQPQDPAFLDISDPKAVLQRSLNNFPCLTIGDIFTFSYNDEVYKIAVLETQPENDKRSICIIDVDLKVDFAPPVGYDENRRSNSGTSTPRSALAGAGAGAATAAGPMARAVGYTAIAPPPAGAATQPPPSNNFVGVGNRVAPRKGKAAAKGEDAAKAGGKPAAATAPPRRTNGPHPLRLEPGQLFFGYEIKPLRKKEGEEEHAKESVHFQGQGNSLRKKGPGK